MSIRLHPFAAPLAGFLFPLLLGGPAAAQIDTAKEPLPSAIFSFGDLAERESGSVRIREMLRGTTHAGFPVDLHVTELAVGQEPHAPHQHVHEELLLILAGELEVVVAGRTSRVGPGSAVYIASGDRHGWRNVGTEPARYFVLALGDDEDVRGTGPGPHR